MDANWTKPENCQKFFDHLMKHLGFKTLDDFYRISPKDISHYGGRALLEKQFDGSLFATLNSAYLHHEWLAWKMEQNVPRGFWNSKENQKHFMDWLGNELGVKDMNHWYSVITTEIRENGGGSLMSKFGDLPSKLLQSIYTEHPWQLRKFEGLLPKVWNSKEN